jgi:PTH1 family peptidyl-tRNA hydrolase
VKLVVGLGNPGPKYETTRHNAGFLVIDRAIDRWGAREQGSSDAAEVYQATVKGEKTLVVKPQTYMNLSGRAVGALAKFYKCAPDDVIVVYDEIDLPFGVMRIKTGGGSGGHNGIKSIDASLGAGQTAYHRVRIGVGRPPAGSPLSAADYVLQQFTDPELTTLDGLFDDVVDAIEMIIQGDIRGAMNRYNGKAQEQEKAEKSAKSDSKPVSKKD